MYAYAYIYIIIYIYTNVGVPKMGYLKMESF